jgi:hypothetical protein
MVEVTLLLDYDEIKLLVHNKFNKIYKGEYPELYLLYIDSLIDSESARFFNSTMSIEDWISRIINVNCTTVISPTHKEYDRINNCYEQHMGYVGDGLYIVAKHNNCFLLDYSDNY